MAQKKSKTGFDMYFESRMKDAEFASEYTGARDEIDATDKLVRALDEVRVSKGLSKAELARQVSAKPEIVRRLFTAESPNPTLATIIMIAKALGLHLELVPNQGAVLGKQTARAARTVRQRATERGLRARNSRPSSLTSS